MSTISDLQCATHIASVAPMDANLPAGVCDSISVGVAGDVYVMAADGSTAVLKNVLAKTVFAIQVLQVQAPTTAGTILARYGA